MEKFVIIVSVVKYSLFGFIEKKQHPFLIEERKVSRARLKMEL